jgi:hypothetical protein
MAEAGIERHPCVATLEDDEDEAPV